MTQHKRDFRTDIQGIRAVAVLLVLVYHIFPKLVPGGYVGVDVFFVISGFLICGHILNEAEKAGRFSILKFYSRRIRRLLPAASAVLVFVAIGTYFLLPSTRWVDTAREIFASVFYVENLYLHHQAIDYLTADKSPSPVQHFWSLSVEEQFYIFWPFIMAAVLFTSHQLKASLRQTAAVVLTVIFGISLYHSYTFTNANPGPAYFHTFTRIWEIALGGILAAIAPFITPIGTRRRHATWLGLAMILYSAFAYSNLTIFPGLAALVPTLGTAFILWGGIGIASEYQNTVQKMLSLKPMFFIGGISYSLYLWHWPLIIFVRDGLQIDLNLAVGFSVLVVSIFAAWASKVFIEDPFRTGGGKDRIGRTFLSGALLMIFPLILAVGLMSVTPKFKKLVVAAPYSGAQALVNPGPSSTIIDLNFVPALEAARNDIASVYSDKCHVPRPDTDPIACIYIPEIDEAGNQYMRKVDVLPVEFQASSIMLVGDSHAAQWLPALKIIGLEQNRAIITHTKSSCAFIDAPLVIGGTPYPECRLWGQLVLEDILKRDPAFVVTSMVTNHFVEGSNSAAENRENLAYGLSSFWDQLGRSKIPVFSINGTPRFQFQVPDCVAKNLTVWTECNLSRVEAMQYGGLAKRATDLSVNAWLVDMTDYLCTADACPVIVGNILVYRDQHHITSTYVKSMAPYLWDKMERHLSD